MEKIYCDKCGKEIKTSEMIRFAIDFKPLSSKNEPKFFDICPECATKFSDWLKGKCACQKQDKPAEQEKPAKQKPAKKMLPAWATIKQLAAIFGQSERRMNRLMARTGASRRKAKEGPNWWYEYQITKETYDYLTSKLECK